MWNRLRSKAFYAVTDPDKELSYTITLVGKVALKALRPLDLKKDDLFICWDAAFDDEAVTNLALQYKSKTIRKEPKWFLAISPSLKRKFAPFAGVGK
jgi:hypothetical protein